MKRIITILACIFLYSASSFAVVADQVKNHLSDNPEFVSIDPALQNMSTDAFLDMTPKKFRQLTGERMGIKNAIKLKAAQKFIKKNQKKGKDISEGVYVLLAILGLGWLAMGILDDWEGSDWLVSLILAFLCWLPGVIYTLVKKSNYY